jgi:hypothetical protein
MPDLENYGLLTIFAVALIAIFGAGEIGRLLGARAVGRGGGDVSTLEGATLGLLALMIGFTFAMALSRFEARRDAVVSEANAIGTTALRARLLPASNRIGSAQFAGGICAIATESHPVRAQRSNVQGDNRPLEPNSGSVVA